MITLRASAKRFTYHTATDADLLELHIDEDNMILKPQIPFDKEGKIQRVSNLGFPYHALIARDLKGNIVGYLTYRITSPNTAVLLTTSARKGYQKQGIGSKLQGLALGQLRKKGVKELHLSSHPDAFGYYKKSKFKMPSRLEMQAAIKERATLHLAKLVPNKPRVRRK